jgi:long-chain acyl-CoA synthetase
LWRRGDTRIMPRSSAANDARRIGGMVQNIATLLAARLAQPGRPVCREFRDGVWADRSAAEVAARAGTWQAGLRAFGLGRGERIAICCRNGMDWLALDQAVLGLGAVVVPLYVDDNAENVAGCLQHSEARLAVVESGRIARQLIAAGVEPQRLVCLRGAAEGLREAGGWLPPGRHEFTVCESDPRELATICYTSGTSGRPKGVMLSHANVLANVEACRATGMARSDDVFLSILPLSHMFERTGGCYLPLRIGATVVFSRSTVHLAEDFERQSPTAVFAVPRLLERLAARIRAAAQGAKLKQMALDLCLAHGAGRAPGPAGALGRLGAALVRPLVRAPVLERLGGRLRLMVVGGAAVDPAVARLFIGIGLPVLHGYGMTEASPVVSVTRLDRNVPESVGRPLDGVEVRLGQDGELLVRGPNVMLGYWRDEAASAHAVDAEGWLHTGDVGELRDGLLYVRGRIKDVLVMSNGEKLPPQDAELAILGDEAIEQAVLVGEGKAFLTLIAVSSERDERALVRRANERLRGFPRYVRVRRAIASAEPWTVENGMLTPTLKVKRARVVERYAAELEAVYRTDTPAD